MVIQTHRYHVAINYNLGDFIIDFCCRIFDVIGRMNPIM